MFQNKPTKPPKITKFKEWRVAWVLQECFKVAKKGISKGFYRIFGLPQSDLQRVSKGPKWIPLEMFNSPGDLQEVGDEISPRSWRKKSYGSRHYSNLPMMHLNVVIDLVCGSNLTRPGNLL